MRWRWAAASEVGTSHIKLGTRKQDAISSFLAGKDQNIFCGIVCDGAGSAAYGGQGASVVCRTLSRALREHFRSSSSLPADQQVWEWVDRARDLLAVAAEGRGVERRAFACTLAVLVASNSEQLTVHVGDGAIIGRISSDDTWLTLSWPENGEYASTTYFVTDDPAPRVRIYRTAHEMSGYAIFTDGIEDLALDLVGLVPHEPFFRSMMSPVDRLNKSGRSISLSDALGSFLAGPRVCAKSDDDKSLILASAR